MGSGCIAPHILDLDTSCRWVSLYPRENNSGTHWIGGWVGPRAGLDDVEKRKFLSLSELELRPLGRPARSQSLYRLWFKKEVVVVSHKNVLRVEKWCTWHDKCNSSLCALVLTQSEQKKKAFTSAMHILESLMSRTFCPSGRNAIWSPYCLLLSVRESPHYQTSTCYQFTIWKYLLDKIEEMFLSKRNVKERTSCS
jgi:hypothetical protein